MATRATFRTSFESDSRAAQQDQQKFARVLAATEREANELEQELKQGERQFREYGTAGKRAARDVRKAGAETKKLASSIKLARGLIAGLGIGVALSLIKRGLTAVNDLWNEQRQALAQVEQGIRSTGGAAGLTADQIADMAAELQDATGIGDEVILRLSSQMLTFSNISERVFGRVAELALDLAERFTNLNIDSAGLQLAKLLNAPSTNLGAAKRAGIEFSAIQIETIKNLEKTNRLFEAQEIILVELERQFGGSARAARDLDFRSLAAETGDLFEQMGRLIQGPMSQFVKGARDMVGGVNSLLARFNDWKEDQNEINRLLEEYVPRVDAAADGTGRFADEVERAAIQQKVLILVNQLAKAFDELADAEENVIAQNQQALSGGGALGLGGTQGAEQLDRAQRLAKLIEELKGQLSEARGELNASAIAAAAAGQTLKEYEQAQRAASQSTGENARSQKELEAALKDVNAELDATFKRIREDVAAQGLAEDLARAFDLFLTSLRESGPVDLEIDPQLDEEILADDVEHAAVSGWAAAQGEVLDEWGRTADEVAAILEDRLADAFAQLLDGFAAAFGNALAAGIRGADLVDVGRQLAGGLGNVAGGALTTALGGGPLAGIAGAGVGALVEVALNEIVDFFDSTAQSFASGEVTLDGATARIEESSAEMDGEVQAAIDTITSTFDSIIDLIGGTPGRGPGFGLVARDNGDIGVWVDNVKFVVGSINEAIDVILRELLLRSDIQGVSATVQAALQNFGNGTAAELGEVLGAALAIDNLGLDELGAQLQAKLSELFELAAVSLSQLGGVGLDAILTGPGGVVSTLTDAFNQLLGIEEPLEEQVERRFRALEAEVLVTRASLLAMLASIQARQAEVEASALSSRVILEGAEVRRLSAEVEAQSAQVTAQAAISSATAWAAASDAINAAITALDGLVFGEAELEQARRASRRAAGSARRGERERLAAQREDARLQLAIAEALESGNEELAARLQAEADLEDQVAAITELLGEEAGARFRAAQEAIAAAAAERELAAARRDALAAANEAAQQAIDSLEDLLAGPSVGAADAAQSFMDLQAELAAQRAELIAQAQDIIDAGGAASPEIMEVLGQLDELDERMDALGDSLGAFLDRIKISLIQDIQALGGELTPEQQTELNRLVFESARLRLLEAVAILASNNLLSDSILSFEELMELIGGLEFDPGGHIETSLEAIQQAALSLGDSLVSAIERFGGAANLTEQQRIALLRLEFVLIKAQLQIRRAELADLIAQGQELGIDTSSLSEGLGVIDDLLDTLNGLEPDFAALANSTAAAAQAAADAAQAATTGADRWATALAAAERIRDFITQRGTDGPFEDIFSRFDAIRDLFETDAIQAALRFLGLSVEEASGILDAMEQAEVAARIEELMGGVVDAIRELTEGELSGVPIGQQVAAARQRFLELSAAAAGGDADAIRQVGQAGLDLVRLAGEAGPDQLRAIRDLVTEQLMSVENLFPEAALRTGGFGAGDVIASPVELQASDVVIPVRGEDIIGALGGFFPPGQGRQAFGGEAIAAAMRAQAEIDERRRNADRQAAAETAAELRAHQRAELERLGIIAGNTAAAGALSATAQPSPRRLVR